jgi:NAD(P)-dependent dehydrogenase (short-subunit alcohol dehydrogenase family)
MDPLEPTQLLAENSDPVFAVKADVRDEVQVTHAVEIILARYCRIDFVVNAAAAFVCGSMDDERLIENALYQVNTNLIGPLLVSAVVRRPFWRSEGSSNPLRERKLV